MTDPTLQEQARALGDPTRHAIFRRLAEASRPMGIAELNLEFPFNHNAIRQHLAKLVAAELVVESTAAGGGRGRPRLLYEVNPAVEGRWGTTGPYERLSRLLLEILRTGESPEEVGRRAADLFRAASPSGDVIADMTAAMARQGFEPELRPVKGGVEMVLRHCPFAAVAVADRALVCSVHLGISEGLAEGGTVAVSELVGYDPRKADCRLRLRVDVDPDDPAAVPTPTLTLRGRSPGA
jgi:predicted ArsR family transcriptional regulator